MPDEHLDGAAALGIQSRVSIIQSVQTTSLAGATIGLQADQISEHPIANHAERSKPPAPSPGTGARHRDGQAGVIELGTPNRSASSASPLRGARDFRGGGSSRRSIAHDFRGDSRVLRTRETPLRWETDAGISLDGGPIEASVDDIQESVVESSTDTGETFPPPYFSILNTRSRRH